MNKGFHITFLLFFSLMLNAQVRKVETFYDAEKKKIKEIYFLKNEKPVGIYESYYFNGKLKSKGNFENNTQSGEWHYFYENGNLKMAGGYNSGKRSGEWTYFFENGKKQMKGALDNGVRNGLWIFYYENEELKALACLKKVKKMENGNIITKMEC